MGADARILWHGDATVHGVDAVVVPGGFAHGDYLRTGAIARFSPVMTAVGEFAAAGGPVVGICNGFQVLTEAGLLPGALQKNAGLTFLCEPVDLRVETSSSVLTAHATPGTVLRIPINHFEGNYVCDADTLRRLRDEDRIVLRYVQNPNGSLDDIAGIANEHGNVVGPDAAPRACERCAPRFGRRRRAVGVAARVGSRLGGCGLSMRAWVRAHWWRPPLTERLLGGRLFGCSPRDAARIVLWLAVASVAATAAVGASVAALVDEEHVWWVGALVGGVVALLMLPVLWVFACAVWTEGRADSPSELVRARRRLQHATAWAHVDGWLEYQLASARNDDPPFDPFPVSMSTSGSTGPADGARSARTPRSSSRSSWCRGSSRRRAPSSTTSGVRCRARQHAHGRVCVTCPGSSRAPRRTSLQLTARIVKRSPVSLPVTTGRISPRHSRPSQGSRSRVAMPNPAPGLRGGSCCVRVGAPPPQAFEDQCLRRDLVGAGLGAIDPAEAFEDQSPAPRSRARAGEA